MSVRLAFAIALVLVLLAAVSTLGAEPTPTAQSVLEGGDPRSEGEGPGLVGSPLWILLGVIALGAVTALISAVIVRLTRRTA